MKQIIFVATFLVSFSLIGQNELPPDSTVLDSMKIAPEMQVVAKRNTLKRKVDRLEFTVEGTSFQNMNAWEILSNTPNVIVRNEAISVRGSDQIIVCINDKRTLMSQDELKLFLESTAGNQIYSIEVITNPPAKYDAEGAAVINIKMKQVLLTGYRATLSARYHQSIYAKGRIGLMQSYNSKKWQLSGNYNFLTGDYVRYNFDEVIFAHNNTRWENDMVRKTTLHQQHLYGFSAQYDIDSLSNIRFGLDGTINPKSTGNYYIPTSIYNTETNVLESNFKTANSRFQKYDMFNAYLSYDKQLKSGTISWLNNFSHKRYAEDQTISTWQNFMNQPESFNRFGNNTKQKIQLVSTQLDYRLEKGDFVFETGAKYSYVKNDNQLKFLNDWNGSLIQDSLRSNQFHYNEQIIAAYVSGEYKWKKWYFKAGLRNEITLIHTTSNNPTVEIQTKRNNLFPTFYALYEINDNQQIGFSYGKRIDRPFYNFLNPSKSYYNYYSYFQGDPYLKSTLIDNVSLTYTIKDWNFEVYYRYTKDPSMEISVQNPETFETIYNFTNIKNGSSLGMYVFKSFSLLSNWKLNAFGMGEYNENYFIGVDNQLHKNKVFFYHFNFSTQLSLDKAKTWDVNIGYRYNSKAIQGSFNISSSQNTYVMISKKLLNKKMEVSLTINDIFKTDKNTISMRYANQNQQFADYRDTRYFIVNVKYNFGNQKIREAKSVDKTDEQNRM